MTTAEKVAYLKGLMEGMKYDKESDEGKLFAAIADILSDIVEDIEDVAGDLYDLGEDVDAISDDLGDVEDYLCGEGDWADDDDWDEDVLDLGSIQCPNCGEMMEFEFDEDDEEESEDNE